MAAEAGSEGKGRTAEERRGGGMESKQSEQATESSQMQWSGVEWGGQGGQQGRRGERTGKTRHDMEEEEKQREREREKTRER